MYLIDRDKLNREIEIAEEEMEAEYAVLGAGNIRAIIDSQPSIHIVSWVACKDELPEIEIAVIFHTKYDGVYVGYRTKDFWYDHTGEMCLPYDEITHWMDIPSCPKGAD